MINIDWASIRKFVAPLEALGIGQGMDYSMSAM